MTRNEDPGTMSTGVSGRVDGTATKTVCRTKPLLSHLSPNCQQLAPALHNGRAR